jgi:hypothetical protein
LKIAIPPAEAANFAKQLRSDRYRKEERDYKLAVHVVISALFSETNLAADNLPTMIADVFGKPMPDLEALGVGFDDQQFVRQSVAQFKAGGLRAALANLAGGKWGLAQFSWLPRAVEFDLGEPIADAFRALIDVTDPLPGRVDAFRDALDVVAQALEKKGGFLPNWSHFRESLSFVAMILTGFNPQQYTFYSKAALRSGYEKYAIGSSWPSGSMGDIYADTCSFVKSVAAALRDAGAPVQDLIDAQSYIWLSFEAGKGQTPATAKPEPKGQPSAEIDRESVAKDLAAAAFWPLDRARRLCDLVQRSGQLIFHGPPGTGKTFVAETISRLLVGDEEGRLEVVQFHPSYAYEDFIEGIRPRVTEGSTLAYEIRKGVFLKLSDRAREYPNDAFFLVIDELNRANLPRVFGELLYALEYRGAEHLFRLPYSNTETYIPQNITLIATMNTADRSIALVDAAIRRRFRHVEFAPDPNVLRAWLESRKLGTIAEHAAGRLVALNASLGQLLDADRLIGHTYLMRDDLGDAGLGAVWAEDIEPVLREHLFNQPEEIIKLRDVFLMPE